MHDLVRIHDVDVKMAKTEVHDMPQVHRTVLVLRNAQQPQFVFIRTFVVL